MAACDGEDNSGSEAVGLGCALELFKEHEEITQIIKQLPSVYRERSTLDITYERFVYILSQYQEQPHLLDPYLDTLLENLLNIGRDPNFHDGLRHKAFQFLYIITKVRNYKVVVRHLPHEVADVEPVLSLLAEQNPFDHETWETRYILLLWLSIIVMIPFHMERLDSNNKFNEGQKKPTMERIIDVIKLYLSVGDKVQDAAAFLASRFITRPDVKEVHLFSFLEWSLQILESDVSSMNGLNLQAGVLAALALLFKHGKREDVKGYGIEILKKVLGCGLMDSKSTVVRKMVLKLIQRIGLSFLPIKVSAWRYNRGSRSLTANLAAAHPLLPVNQGKSESEEHKTDEDYELPDEMEDIIEQLLNGLRDKDTVISVGEDQASAVEHLLEEWGVIDRSLELVLACVLKDCMGFSSGPDIAIFNQFYQSWEYMDQSRYETPTDLDKLNSLSTGIFSCTCHNVFGRRGILLPQYLEKVVPVILKALVYDEVRGNFSVGAHIRDAACYVCWSFARAYSPEILKPYVMEIAGALLVTSVFDREINCRRAASAAFQENVGRQGTFPHGIDIVTAVDYFAVGSRTKSYLKISAYIAQFPEYTMPLINHLLKRKVQHWDTSIRELTAQTLYNLTSTSPTFMVKVALPLLIPLTKGIDLCARHGGILAVAQIIHALANYARSNNQKIKDIVGAELITEIQNIPVILTEKKLFRGIGGELMRHAVCVLIEKSSLAALPFHELWDIIDLWQDILEQCLRYVEPDIRAYAVSALSALCIEYYGSCRPRYTKLLDSCLLHLKSTQQEARCGNALAIGSLPKFVFAGSVQKVIDGLVECATLIENESTWAESRRDAVKALSSVCQTIGGDLTLSEDGQHSKENIDRVYGCLLAGMKDYTLSNRGDIGAMVREAAMVAVQEVTLQVSKSDVLLITKEISSQLFCALIQQNVEKIDRIRLVAGTAFSTLLHSSPQVPNIPHRNDLVQVFSQDVCHKVNWAAPAETFPLFMMLLCLKTYTYSLLRGVCVSVGGLTESLVKYSRASLLFYLNSVQNDMDTFNYICETLLKVFKNNLGKDYVTIPFLKTVDHLLAAGVFTIFSSLVNHSFPLELLDLCWKEVAKSKDPQKIMAAIDVFCGLLQFPEVCGKRALTILAIHLCHRYPRIRKVTADKIYEALISYPEITSEDAADDVMTILSDTEWDVNVEVLRPIRNKLCELLGIPAPKSVK
ncbi:tubulin-specific chaperone D-like [Limulus polyphemus]|uniref:Tubulin-specific chaperone D n=1 Tax=Limulus polyphemus TaxID=6850 RepID=A0ABM1SM61_LIMPO|nr:tubulin-specific chaperone D-like [Limulus polyphemus]